MKDIEPRLKYISNYLKIQNTESFVIPEYQRGYSWNSVHHCDKLMQDIKTYIDQGSEEPYFFGTIIVDCSEAAGEYNLIDGQQRTTTFVLLLKALLLRLQEVLKSMSRDDDSEVLEESLKDNRNKIIEILYKTDAEGRASIKKDWSKVRGVSIIKNNSINEQFKDELQIILESEDYYTAEKSCYKYPRKQKDNKYTNFFRNFKFFYDTLGSFGESELNTFAKKFLNECQVIEIRSWQTEQAITMFNSLNSTGMPLTDADIISAKLYSEAGDNKSEFNTKWKEIIRLTSQLSERKIATIDSVLQQYMYINRAETRIYQKNGSIDVSTPGLRNYYTVINKELLNDPISLCDKLYKIASIWHKIKDYSIVKLLLKFNENVRLYLISYLNRFSVDAITEDKVTKISTLLLRLFTILELVETGYSSKNFKTFLFRENLKFVDISVTEDELLTDFNNHIQRNWQRDNLSQLVFEYEKNILVFLNEYLYSEEMHLNFKFSENVNIEHIMPASGRNIESIREDANIEDKEEFDNIVNKLGNKILLEEDINKSIGKDWFKTKKQKSILEKSGYKNSQYLIAPTLCDYPKDIWTKEDIIIITEKITKRILNFIFGETYVISEH